MTKYILHGGATRVKSQSNRDFFIEILKDLEEPINLLISCHSKELDRWEEVFEGLKKRFTEESPNKNVAFVLASADAKTLTQQIKEATAIYLHGGDTPKLFEALKQVPNLKELFQNKTIAASSAGVYVLSKYYYTQDYENLCEGLNILPIKSICHHSEAKMGDLEKLKNFKEEMEVVAIEEEKFIIKYV